MPLILVGLIFAALGLGFVGFPVAALIHMIVIRRRQKTWTPVMAEIENLSEITRQTSYGPSRGGSHSHTRSSVVAQYRYTAPDGSEHTGQSGVGKMKFSLDNPQLNILVDPNNPASSTIAGGSGAGELGCVLVIATPFILAGLFSLWLAFVFFQGP